LFKDDSDSESSDEEEEKDIKPENNAFIPMKDHAELILENGITKMNGFLNKVQQFERATND